MTIVKYDIQKSELLSYLQKEQAVPKKDNNEINSNNFINDHLKKLFDISKSNSSSNFKEFKNLDSNYMKLLVNHKVGDKCLIIEAALNGNLKLITWLFENG